MPTVGHQERAPALQHYALLLTAFKEEVRGIRKPEIDYHH